MRRAVLCSIAVVLATAPAAAQPARSGSTGADGAFAPTADVRLTPPADGVFDFTTITIPFGVTVSFERASGHRGPISLLATGDVRIDGRIDVSGSDGGVGGHGTQLFGNAGSGGPGGFDGGLGSNGLTGLAGSAGLGPGGGQGGSASNLPGHAGHLTAGGGTHGGGSYGVDRLVPLVGGSGGGGGAVPLFGLTAGGGGGGGGAILVASSGTLTLNGLIDATGGNGGASGFGGPAGGAGSGGAVRLLATTLTGTGTIDVSGGAGASPGRIRIEAFTNTATLAGGAAGGVTVGIPDVTTLDSVVLRVVAVNGIEVPAEPAASYQRPDIVLPVGTTSPVTVTLEASQIPLGTTVTVTATPLSGPTVVAVSTPLSGTPAAATATATLAVPTSQPSIIAAHVTFVAAAAP